MTLVQTVAGAALAVVLIVAGVAVLWGLGWSLLAGGVLLLAGVVALYDPVPGKRGGP